MEGHLNDALTVMVVDKVSGSTPVTIGFPGFSVAGTAQVYRLTASNAITRLGDLPSAAEAYR